MMTIWLHAIVITISFLQAVFVLGSTIMLMAHYWADPRYKHIVMISASHVMLTILVVHSSVVGLYQLFWWRLPFVMIAFGLSDYAIINIYASARKRLEGHYKR